MAKGSTGVNTSTIIDVRKKRKEYFKKINKNGKANCQSCAQLSFGNYCNSLKKTMEGSLKHINKNCRWYIAKNTNKDQHKDEQTCCSCGHYQKNNKWCRHYKKNIGDDQKEHICVRHTIHTPIDKRKKKTKKNVKKKHGTNT